ncbi:MAG: peptide-methionine (S)-S-oxide reductase MsrA [Patescibacteria group bacterium]
MAKKAEGKSEVATFGAGCFWHVEEAFRPVKGVLETAVGYMGGSTENPSYEAVCTDKTGHVEVAQVTFDPSIVSFEEILNTYWGNHNPTQMNRQGPDVGTQYRSVVFYHSPEQKAAAERLKVALVASGKFSKPIVTAIEPAQTFYKAEDYHQKYLAKRGLSSCPV